MRLGLIDLICMQKWDNMDKYYHLRVIFTYSYFNLHTMFVGAK